MDGFVTSAQSISQSSQPFKERLTLRARKRRTTATVARIRRTVTAATNSGPRSRANQGTASMHSLRVLTMAAVITRLEILLHHTVGLDREESHTLCFRSSTVSHGKYTLHGHEEHVVGAYAFQVYSTGIRDHGAVRGMLQKCQSCVTIVVHRETNSARWYRGQLRDNRCEIDIHLAFPVGAISRVDGGSSEFSKGKSEDEVEKGETCGGLRSLEEGW